MEENVLQNTETFFEFPNKYMKVDSKSNYYYLKKDDKAFITVKEFDSISYDGKDTITTVYCYYNVLDGRKVSDTVITEIDDKPYINNKGFTIVSLSDMYDTSENSVYYLCEDDIDAIVNYKEENAKTLGLKPRPNYF